DDAAAAFDGGASAAHHVGNGLGALLAVDLDAIERVRRPAEEGNAHQLLLDDVGGAPGMREDGEHIPVRLVLGRDDAAAGRDVLGAGDIGVDTGNPAQEDEVRPAPVAGQGPAQGGAALHDQPDDAHDDGDDGRLADEQDVEQGRTYGLDRKSVG